MFPRNQLYLFFVIGSFARHAGAQEAPRQLRAEYIPHATLQRTEQKIQGGTNATNSAEKAELRLTAIAKGNYLNGNAASSNAAAPARRAAPVIDGALDEPIWQASESGDHFTQREPHEGQRATENTEVRVLFDDENLYFGFRCYDKEPEKIVAKQMRNDGDLDSDDNVAVLLDTYHDHRNGFLFQTNPLGARFDAQVTDEGRNVNEDWNCVWEAEARITKTGWEAEIRISLNQLRYPDTKHAAIWGVNFKRDIRRKNEDVYWSPIRRDYGFRGFYRISKFGELTGLQAMPQRSRLELKPYTISGRQKEHDQDDLISPVSHKTIFNSGLDLKYGLTANLIADVTVNTDFAQVEADQERVNLTRFSLFFPEKRDFFLEGAGIFRIGESGEGGGGGGNNENLFYSRRLGLQNGAEVPIIAGSKVTGKIGSMQMGLLDVVTERATYEDDEGNPAQLPRTNFSALRLRRDILKSSNVGLMVLSRDPFAGNDYNRTFVADGNFVFGTTTTISSWLARTQSPDLVKKDWAGNFSLNYRTDRQAVRLNYTDIQDNFNAEMGFVRRVGIRRLNVEIGRGLRPQSSWLRRLYIAPTFSYLTDQNQGLLTREAGFRTVWFMNDGGFAFGEAEQTYDVLDETWEIREGIFVPAGAYRFIRPSLFYRSDPGRLLGFNVNGSVGGFYGGNTIGGGLGLIVRPSAHFAVDLNYDGNVVRLPIRDRRHSDGAVEKLPDARFSTTVLSTRLTYTFSTSAFAKAYVQWNDTAKTLALNFLFNYYYRPGSDIYLVYNHNWDLAGNGTLTANRALMLKANYWLNL